MRVLVLLESFYNVARKRENAKGENASCRTLSTSHIHTKQLQKFDNKVYKVILLLESFLALWFRVTEFSFSRLVAVGLKKFACYAFTNAIGLGLCES